MSFHTVWLEIDVHETSVIVFVALSLKPVGTLALSLYRMWSVIIITVLLLAPRQQHDYGPL